MTKISITALAAAITIASPAMAQVRGPYVDPYIHASPYAYSGPRPNAYAGPYAYSGPSDYSYSQRRMTTPSHDVYSTRGEYLGSDPDPLIRNELARDPAAGR